MEFANENVPFNQPGIEPQGIPQAPTKKLWNPIGFVVISALFSFFPAGILYALNCGRLGQAKKRNIALLVSFLGFAGVITAACLIDLSILRTFIYALNIGAGLFMYRDQTDLFKSHVLTGGRKASYLVPVILCVVATAATIVLIIVANYVPEEKIMVGNSKLYYTQSVQKSEAQKLGDYLGRQGFFSESTKTSVKLDKKAATYEFSLIVDKSKLNDDDTMQICKYLASELSTNVFNNSKVNVVLCDDTLKPLKTLSSE